MTQPGWSAPLDAPDTGVSYTNGITVGTTQWDFVLDFQVSVPVQGNPQPTSQPVSRLVMSPMHAKVLVEVLQQAVKAWERPAAEPGNVGSWPGGADR
jgi:hypothetical protein